MVVTNLWFLLQEMGLVDPHRITYGWQSCRVQGKNTYTILRFKQGLDRHLSVIGKSLRFTIPHSKANNKSKSVWWSIHPAPKSLPCIRFSESRILTLGHPHKHCRISLVDEPSSEKSIDSAGQTNIYRSLTTLWFCVNSYRIVGWSVVEPSWDDQGSSIWGYLLLFWIVHSRTMCVLWRMYELFDHCVTWWL